MRNLKVNIEFTAPSYNPVVYTFTNARISAQDTTFTGGGVFAVEEVQFVYDAVTITTTGISSAGVPQAPFSYCWSVTKNGPC